MKYLTLIMGLFLVLILAGCDKTKDKSADLKDTATETVKRHQKTLKKL